MDPISIAAAVFGIGRSISSLNSGVRWIASLKNAPSEFLDLQNELGTVQGYLHTLQPILEGLPNAPDAGTPRPDLTHIAQITESLTAEAEELVQLMEAFRAQAVRLDQNGQPRIKKVRWRRSIATVSTHRDRVRRMRMELASAVGLLQPAQSTLILGVQQASRAEIRALKGLIRDETQRLELSIEERFSANISATDTNEGRPTNSQEAFWADGGKASHIASGDTDDGGQGYVRLSANLIRRCDVLCLCQCHHNRRMQSSMDPDRLPRSILGSLLLDYNCIPIWDPRPCNDPRCVSRAGGNTSYMSLIYLFPAWLFNKALSIRVSWGSLTDHGASLHISVARILPGDHEVLWAIENSRLDIVQSNLSSRTVVPTDVTPAGTSLLGYALNQKTPIYNPAIAELLLSLTKDLTCREFKGTSLLQYATIILRSETDRSHPGTAVMEEIVRRAPQEYEYPTGETLVHKSLFQTGTNLSLEEALTLDSSSIDAMDGAGYTPLFWACVRADTNAVRLLLRHGADVNARSTGGQTPLLIIPGRAGGGQTEILNALLEMGADVNAEANDGFTPLTRAVEEEDLVCFNTLISHGARSLPIRRVSGTSIGHFLADFCNPSVQIPMLESLVEQGYDMDVPNGYGHTPVLLSVWLNTAVGVKAFADHGADLTVRDNQGRTILHLAAQYATRDVFRELESRLPGLVDPRALDNEGKTAMEYFRDRVPLPDEDVSAFESLVRTLKIVWEQQAVRIDARSDESLDEEDEFFDAEAY